MDKDRIVRNCLRIGLILLFIGMIVPSISPQEAIGYGIMTTEYPPQEILSSRKIIYVDINNSAGPWDGTLQHPYPSITKAYPHATDGDTIFVFHGFYWEANQNIEKSITIAGENPATTSLKMIFFLQKDGVTIRNFTLSPNSWDACGIAINSNNNTIQNNIITQRSFGIAFWSGNGNLIEGNIIENCYHGTGIQVLWETNYNTIRNNLIRNNFEDGIRLIGDHHHNIIENNTLTHNGDGIDLWGPLSHDSILNNIIENNSGNGIHFSGDSDSNIISGNSIRNNNGSGISLMGKKNLISGNTFINNTEGIFLTSGINIISNNNFINNRNEASFEYPDYPRRNLWMKNYWGRPYHLPKLIHGEACILRIEIIPEHDPEEIWVPWCNVDVSPRAQPYDTIRYSPSEN